jgi:CHAT domain-containing protein/Tfp pilus assembly protein PilF
MRKKSLAPADRFPTRVPPGAPFLFLLVALALPGGPARGGDAPKLTPGEEIQREMAGGEAHRYPIALAAGQFLRAVVAEDGVDVEVNLLDPEGQKVAHVDAPSQPHEDEDLAAIAERSGPYQLEVRQGACGKTGRYRVRIELKPAGEEERKRVEAVRLTQEAADRMNTHSPESLHEQVVGRERSLVLWRELGERQYEAAALYQLGTAYAALKELDRAVAELRQAAVLWKELGDRINEADAYNQTGLLEERRGRQKAAIEPFAEALSRLDGPGVFPQLKAAVLNNLGNLLINLGQPRDAVSHLREALALYEKTDVTHQVNVLNNLGSAYTDLAESQEALRCYEQALKLAKDQERSPKSRQGQGPTQCNREPGAEQLRHRAATLNNLGELYDSLGDNEKALERYQQALEIDRKLNDPRSEARTLNNIGLARQKLGQLAPAEEAYRGALDLARQVPDPRTEVTALANLGFLELRRHRPAAALEWSRQALERTADDAGAEAIARHVLGVAQRELGQLAEAETELARARAICQAREDRNRAASLTRELALVAHARHDLDMAKERIESAIATVESLRTQVASPDLRASFLATKADYYETAILILMDLHRARPADGYAARALQMGERARARSLLEILNSSGTDLHQGVPRALLDRKRRASQEVSVHERRRAKLAADPGGDAKALAAETQALEAALDDYQKVEVELRQSSPRYAALTQPQPLSLREIEQLLDNDTVLLEYALGEKRSYLWAVSRSAVQSFHLPPRARIEKAARRFYDLARTSPAARHVTGSDPEVAAAARELSDMILRPAARSLAGRRLLVVAEGTLQYVPFAALPTPDDAASAPLVERHEIVSLPSASVLAVLRQERRRRSPPQGTLAVLADPVFRRDDPRLTQGKIPEPQPNLTRGDCSSDPANFARLRFSEEEAITIAKLVPEKDRLVKLGLDASLPTAMDGRLGRYRLVHFATHGCIDSRHPELSSLVLSQVDTKGRPREGFLRLKDIYNLELHADLVTLSACQTALGKEVRGEGLIGLTRGFMYAGAARVLASLWSVDDRATAKLMEQFYSNMLTKKLRPAAALEQAQREMARDPRWAAPYYWAGFSLQGEWR